jgi:hypothetical protein
MLFVYFLIGVGYSHCDDMEASGPKRHIKSSVKKDISFSTNIIDQFKKLNFTNSMSKVREIG